MHPGEIWSSVQAVSAQYVALLAVHRLQRAVALVFMVTIDHAEYEVRKRQTPR